MREVLYKTTGITVYAEGGKVCIDRGEVIEEHYDNEENRDILVGEIRDEVLDSSGELEKLHDDTEIWTYTKEEGNVIVSFRIDGELRIYGESLYYLENTYKMELGDAVKYLNEIKRHV